MSPEVLDQHRDLDRTETEAAAGLVDLDPEPTLVDHRRPQGPVERVVAAGVGADPLRRREVVEQIARTLAQRQLLFGEIEVHRRRV